MTQNIHYFLCFHFLLQIQFFGVVDFILNCLCWVIRKVFFLDTCASRSELPNRCFQYSYFGLVKVIRFFFSLSFTPSVSLASLDSFVTFPPPLLGLPVFFGSPMSEKNGSRRACFEWDMTIFR